MLKKQTIWSRRSSLIQSVPKLNISLNNNTCLNPEVPYIILFILHPVSEGYVKEEKVSNHGSGGGEKITAQC